MRGDIAIREAIPSDLSAVVDLLADSAKSQGAPDSLCVDHAALLRDGFGTTPRVHLLVAVARTEIVAVAVYFFSYSTWTSINGLHLEDLYVATAWRRHGIARALVKALTRVAQRAGCRCFQWLVLRSNQEAIRFYESLGAAAADDWLLMQLPHDRIERLAAD
jgi:ribosomal protein S18 acetylase RimI-like enzyme